MSPALTPDESQSSKVSSKNWLPARDELWLSPGYSCAHSAVRRPIREVGLAVRGQTTIETPCRHSTRRTSPVSPDIQLACTNPSYSAFGDRVAPSRPPPTRGKAPPSDPGEPCRTAAIAPRLASLGDPVSPAGKSLVPQLHTGHYFSPRRADTGTDAGQATLLWTRTPSPGRRGDQPAAAGSGVAR
jgi:hypothetical protein